MAGSKHKDKSVIREHLIRLLFLKEFHEADELDEQSRLYFDDFFPNEEMNNPSENIGEDSKDTVLLKFNKIISFLPEIDAILVKEMQRWSLKRIGLIEKSILRLSVFEMVYDQVPVKVSINEAVELAKIYGPGNSPGFINGVLARVVKGLDENGQQSSSDKD